MGNPPVSATAGWRHRLRFLRPSHQHTAFTATLLLMSAIMASRVIGYVREAYIAWAFGAGGVPFFVVDRTYGVSGAQPVEVFTQVLERAWADAHPVLEMVPGGDACGPDGCEV